MKRNEEIKEIWKVQFMEGTAEVINVGWSYSQQEAVRGDKRENKVVKSMTVPWQ